MQSKQLLIGHLEELAANAWPPEIVQVVDGWRLRFTHGVTRRANSVWPNLWIDKASLNTNLDLVEEFYKQHQLPARYQICPAMQPANLDEQLVARGYRSDARTAVQIASLDTIVANIGHRAADPSVVVKVSEQFTDTWFATYCEAEQVQGDAATIRQQIIQRIAPRTGYALLTVDGEPAALGLGVLERGWLGIFNMATRPEYRRRGAAFTILGALVDWAQGLNATHAYLQVMMANQAAHSLYTKLGFDTIYHYHYREKIR